MLSERLATLAVGRLLTQGFADTRAELLKLAEEARALEARAASRRSSASPAGRRSEGPPEGRAPSRHGLTPRQAECLAAVERLTKPAPRFREGRPSEAGGAGVPPSYAELAAELGLRSKSGAFRLVQELIERGHLSALGRRGRSLVVIPEGEPGPPGEAKLRLAAKAFRGNAGPVRRSPTYGRAKTEC